MTIGCLKLGTISIVGCQKFYVLLLLVRYFVDFIVNIIIKSSFEDKYDQQSHMTITYSICNTIN